MVKAKKGASPKARRAKTPKPQPRDEPEIISVPLVEMLDESEKAYKVEIGPVYLATWLPKSQVEFEGGDDGMGFVTIPDWLLRKRSGAVRVVEE